MKSAMKPIAATATIAAAGCSDGNLGPAQGAPSSRGPMEAQGGPDLPRLLALQGGREANYTSPSLNGGKLSWVCCGVAVG